MQAPVKALDQFPVGAGAEMGCTDDILEPVCARVQISFLIHEHVIVIRNDPGLIRRPRDP